jgi:hypothetical protein
MLQRNRTALRNPANRFEYQCPGVFEQHGHPQSKQASNILDDAFVN